MYYPIDNCWGLIVLNVDKLEKICLLFFLFEGANAKACVVYFHIIHPKIELLFYQKSSCLS